MGLLADKLVKTPMVKGALKGAETNPFYLDVTGYRRLLRKLLYLTTTRPDIVCMRQLSQAMSKPKMGHYLACLGVLRYLKQCPAYGLFY
jgi:hypothetical protein